MGFGISDNVLEKILAEPWSTSYDFKKADWIRSKNISTVLVAPKSKVTASMVSDYNAADDLLISEENKNIAFIIEIFRQIKTIFSDGTFGAFKSTEYKKMFEVIKEHFEDTLIALDVADSFATHTANAIQAQEYLFEGVAERIFYIITHFDFDKPFFRNIIDDTCLLMQKWQIGIDSSLKKHKEIFFSYYTNRFGLKEHPYHCCPLCGSTLISGVANCPNCFANTRSISVPGKTSLSHNEGISKKTCSVEEAEENSTEVINRLKAENERLKAIILKLSSKLDEKDNAITAMSAFIKDTETHDVAKRASKILIIGDSQLPEHEIMQVVSEAGFGLFTVELKNDYSKIKKYAARIRNDAKYAGIIVGATPHKVKNLGNATSLATLFKGEGYPFATEARTYQGDLKITRESLKKALSNLMYHLVSKGEI